METIGIVVAILLLGFALYCLFGRIARVSGQIAAAESFNCDNFNCDELLKDLKKEELIWTIVGTITSIVSLALLIFLTLKYQ